MPLKKKKPALPHKAKVCTLFMITKSHFITVVAEQNTDISRMQNCIVVCNCALFCLTQEKLYNSIKLNLHLKTKGTLLTSFTLKKGQCLPLRNPKPSIRLQKYQIFILQNLVWSTIVTEVRNYLNSNTKSILFCC